MNIKRSSTLYKMALRTSKREMTRGCDVFFFAAVQAFSTFILPVLIGLFVVFFVGMITELFILQSVGINDTITLDDAASMFVTGSLVAVGISALGALLWFFCSKITIID